MGIAARETRDSQRTVDQHERGQNRENDGHVADAAGQARARNVADRSDRDHADDEQGCRTNEGAFLVPRDSRPGCPP
jgi:hypothetical protein